MKNEEWRMKSEEWRISCVPLLASGRAERLPRRRMTRSIYAHSWFILAHSCYAVGKYIYVCDATRMCMNESRIIMNAAPNIIHGSFTGHSCYRRDARMKREWAVNFIFALLPQGGVWKNKIKQEKTMGERKHQAWFYLVFRRFDYQSNRVLFCFF